MIDLTKEEIVNLNRRLVQEFGGSFGIQNESNLDFVLAKVKNARDIFKKTAELMYGINKGHPFLDGNKRTALESAKIMLMANGIKLKFDQKEVEEFMVKMAQPQYLTLKEVELWIKEHSDQHGEAEV